MSISQAERDKVPAEDFAGPGRTFPIRGQQDVHDAARLIGHADDPEAVKRRIIAIARRKGLKIPEAWMSDTTTKSAGPLVMMGPAVKAMGDGRVSGYLVTWGNEATKDAEGEWFTAETDFDTEFPARASVYYHHGQDPAVGRQRLTHGQMEQDEFGVRIDAQLDVRNPKQAAIYRRVERGEMGWSSGSLPHITIPPRENPGGPILQWPLGHDASLTKIPSDRRNAAVAVKSEPLPPVDALAAEGGSASLADDTDSAIDAATAAVARLDNVLPGYEAIAAKSDWRLSASRRARLDELEAVFAHALERLRALNEQTRPRDAATQDAKPRDAATDTPSPAMGEGATETGGAPGVLLPIASAMQLDQLFAGATHNVDLGLSPVSVTAR